MAIDVTYSRRCCKQTAWATLAKTNLPFEHFILRRRPTPVVNKYKSMFFPRYLEDCTHRRMRHKICLFPSGTPYLQEPVAVRGFPPLRSHPRARVPRVEGSGVKLAFVVVQFD